MTGELFYIPGMTLDAVEKKVILYSLRWHRGNQSKTAESLGISAKTLYSKLRQYEEEGKRESKSNQRSGDQG